MTFNPSSGWTSVFLDRLIGDDLSLSSQEREALIASAPHDAMLHYNAFIQRTFGLSHHYPANINQASFPYTSEYGDLMMASMYSGYQVICRDLYTRLVNAGVPGALIEFGLYKGGWLSPMLEHMEATGLIRPCFGFDSFEGLPKPNSDMETENWKQGMFACSLEQVAENLSAHRRPHLKLIKGWFKDTLPTAEAQAIKEVAYAKIDCDLYEPTVEILDYLRGRMTHGSVMVFDDWTHVLFAGETKAFVEWLPTVPDYEFECIGYVNFRYMIRVWHKGKPRIAELSKPHLKPE